MTTPVFAPDIATYASRTPYITAQEFKEAGTGVDVSQLVPASASAADQAAALTRVIARASAWADSLTYKILAATLDRHAGWARVRGDGTMLVPLKFSPVVAVTAVASGSSPWEMAAWPSLARVAITSPKLVLLGAGSGPVDCWARSGRQFVQIDYVNGWACTTLSAAAAAGASSITVANGLAIWPGMVLTVDDGGTTETVTVASSFAAVGAAGPTVVPLAAPLASAHAVGVACSAMPQDIKQAVIALTACLIKLRGSEAFVMGSLRAEPAKEAIAQAGGMEDFELANDLLEPFRRVW